MNIRILVIHFLLVQEIDSNDIVENWDNLPEKLAGCYPTEEESKCKVRLRPQVL